MLVLTRKIGEKIVIGEDIYVCVIEVNNNKVRLGIEAPSSVSINRLEVHLRESEGLVEVDVGNEPAPVSHRGHSRRRPITSRR